MKSKFGSFSGGMPPTFDPSKHSSSKTGMLPPIGGYSPDNFRSGGDKSYKLGYASSYDLKQWDRDDSFIASISERTNWDESMQCYPNLFVFNGSLYCAYNGNEFGKLGFGLAKFKG